MPAIALPQEIIDNTFPLFASERSSVSKCALVCRDWVHGAQAVLFSSITISLCPDRASDRWLELEDILEHKPYLAVFVRSLTLEVDASVRYRAMQWRGHHTFEFYWLPNLRSLTLQLFSIPNLHCIYSTLASIPRLEHLALYRAQAPRIQNPADPEPSTAAHDRPGREESQKTPSLRTLRVDSCNLSTRLAREMLHLGHTRALSSLDLFGSTDRELAAWFSILPSIASSIRHLGLSISEDIGTPTETLSKQADIIKVYNRFLTFPNLASIAIELRAHETAHNVSNHVMRGSVRDYPLESMLAPGAAPTTSPFFLTALADLLTPPAAGSNTLPSPSVPFPALEQLTFKIDGMACSLHSCGAAAARLADVLTAYGYYPSFARVSVPVEEPRLARYEWKKPMDVPRDPAVVQAGLAKRADGVRAAFSAFEVAGCEVEVEVWKGDNMYM
ncbi:hypothetical protein C8Q80DRAFT_436948 [Daedaleopsis nitida]|nr:hypothetical protein C8Q80DRAFT_436948 [Daedaleopsis nitida]